MTTMTSENLTLRGGVARFAQLVLSTPDADGWREFLVEGPSGTGKSMGILVVLDRLCWIYRKLQILVLRKVAKDCADSVKMTLEERVFELYQGGIHPAKTARNASRKFRNDYEYPNGSRMVFGGLNNKEQLKSTEWDIVYFNEATEGEIGDWEYCINRARGNMKDPAIPYPFCIADCNPDVPYHWLNRRPEEADEDAPGRTKMLRLKSLHKDNPAITDRYIKNLRAMTGARRKRLYEGLWVASEGMVYEHFDHSRHVVDTLPRVFAWYFAAKDFGFNDPGCLQVWGVLDGTMTLVAEVYQTGKDIDWWAQVSADLWHEFRISFGVADPSRPDLIKLLNKKLARLNRPGIWHKGNNKILAGLDLVRGGLGQEKLGPPRIKFYRHALRLGKDPELDARGKPTCTVEELPAYRYPTESDTRPVDEKPDPLCDDQGCDTLRYAAGAFWGKELERMRTTRKYAPGTFGDAFGHAEFEESLQ